MESQRGCHQGQNIAHLPNNGRIICELVGKRSKQDRRYCNNGDGDAEAALEELDERRPGCHGVKRCLPSIFFPIQLTRETDRILGRKGGQECLRERASSITEAKAQH